MSNVIPINKNQMSTTTTTTATTPKKTFNAKLERFVFDQLIWLRDYKPDEVAVLGQTKPEDPLHVIDIHLVKQEVSPGRANMDGDDVTRHVENMIDKGVMPINSERFWIHTHPMTGDGSANPSSIDMDAWTCPENANKNFMVMFILSRSGHVTCKVRVKEKCQVKGLENVTCFTEEEANVEIVDTLNYAEKVKENLIKILGQKAVELIPYNALSQYIGFETLFPEKHAELKANYEKYVSGINNNNNKAIGFQQGNSAYYQQNNYGSSYSPSKKSVEKIKLSWMTITGLLAIISEHKTDIKDLEEINDANRTTFNRINEIYKDVTPTDLKQSYQAFIKDHYRPKASLTKIFQACLTSESLYNKNYPDLINVKTLSLPDKVRFLNVAGATYLQAKTLIDSIGLNRPDNDIDHYSDEYYSNFGY